MKISWYGKGCFLLKGSSITVLMDPNSKELLEKIKPADLDLVIKSNPEYEYKHDLVFDWPGEYETKGLGVVGLPFRNSNDEEVTVFILSHGNIRICHLGMMDRDLTDEEIASLGDIDVLFLPVGGKDVMSAKVAHKVLEAVDPRMAVPMHFSVEGEADGYAPIDDFKKEMGIKEELEAQESVEIKNLSEEQTEVSILSRVF